MISIVKGAKDILPPESCRWQYVERRFRETCEKYGFQEIRTPVFEHTELFARGVGDTTDIVQKEMYSFEIKDRSLALKPEGTAGVVRAFIENKLYAGTLPAKYYYITPCFRYEKMQKGRQRQFHQFGVEIFGADSMLADAEAIAMAMDLLGSLGVKGLELRINSIGCPTCRGEYRKALQDFLRPHFDELCEDCRGRFDRNPMRILDCKKDACKKIAQGAPRMLDFLCGDCRGAFEELKADLTAMGIAYTVDPGIVRGLDYYTKTAFEIVSNDLGAQSTVCGGGRYDHLVEEIGGPATPGIGWGMGIERLLLTMEGSGAAFPEDPGCDVFVAALGDAASRKALSIASELRAAGLKACVDVMGRGLKAQMKYADRLGSRWCVVLGDDELAKGAAVLRDMKNSAQSEVPFGELLARLKKELQTA